MSDSLQPHWTAACLASPSINNSQSVLKLMPIKSVMPSNHLILCCLLFLPPTIFPTSGSFPMSQFLASGGQSIVVSVSSSVLPMNIQDLFPLGLTGWISFQSKGLSRAFSNTTVQNHQFYSPSFPYGPTLTSIHDYWKTIALTRWTFVSKVMPLLFNMLSRFVIDFPSRSKCLSFMAAVTICSDFGT